MSDLTFRAKLTLGVCGLVLLTSAAVAWLAHRSAVTSTQALARSIFHEVSNHAAVEARAYVLRAAPLVESLVQLANNGLALDDSDRLAGQLLAVLKANDGLSWVSYGDKDGNFTGAYRPVEGGMRINQSRIVDGRTRLVEHDVMPDGSLKPARKNDDSGYDPRARPYYKKASETGRLAWIRPYVFFNQGVPGVSCAAPVYDADHRLRGVISIDFDLKALSTFISRLSTSENSQIFLFTDDEILLAHPSLKTIKVSDGQNERKLVTLADTGDPLVEALRKKRAAGKQPAQSASETPPTREDAFEFVEFENQGVDYFGSTSAFKVGDDLTWFVGAVAPKADFLGDVWRSQRVSLAVGGGALLVAVGLAALMARRVSGPVLSLIGFMQRVGEGDLDAKAEFSGSREFRQLSAALNRMIADLRDRLRLRHSLNIAMEVQQKLLPQHPPKPRGLDVAGHSTYCDETGGDYYDFLILDDAQPECLFVALGDVMGHGVASALVMAGARAVLRDRAQKSGSLAELLDRLNRLLAADHEGTRFMTMYLAVVNGRDRVLRWASAGHDPAIVYDPSPGSFIEIEGGDLPLGVVEGTAYSEQTWGPLAPGQIIVIGTDGVWEMPNAAGEQFGKDRLRDVIQTAAAKPSAGIVDAVVASLAQFRGDRKPTDDVTFVVIKIIQDCAPTAVV